MRDKIILTKDMFSKGFFDRCLDDIYFTLSDEGTILINHNIASDNPEFAEIEVYKKDGNYVYDIDVFSCNCGYSLDKDSDEELYENTSIEDNVIDITSFIYSDVCEYITYLSSIKDALDKL